MKERTRKTRKIETTMKKQGEKFDVIFQVPKHEDVVFTRYIQSEKKFLHLLEN